MVRLTTHNVEETEATGERLGRILSKEEIKPVLLLIGDLGAGKTALTRGIARGLGARGPVQSPTFTFVREYHSGGKMGNPLLIHVDLYRLNEGDSIVDLGLDDFLHGDFVVAIEWGERARGVIPRKHLEIHLEHAGPEERVMSFHPEDDPLWKEFA